MPFLVGGNNLSRCWSSYVLEEGTYLCTHAHHYCNSVAEAAHALARCSPCDRHTGKGVLKAHHKDYHSGLFYRHHMEGPFRVGGLSVGVGALLEVVDHPFLDQVVAANLYHVEEDLWAFLRVCGEALDGHALGVHDLSLGDHGGTCLGHLSLLLVVLLLLYHVHTPGLKDSQISPKRHNSDTLSVKNYYYTLPP